MLGEIQQVHPCVVILTKQMKLVLTTNTMATIVPPPGTTRFAANVCKDDAVAHYNNVSKNSLLSFSSDGTVVPGMWFEGTVVPVTQIEGAEDATAVMQITPYNAFTDCHRCEAMGCAIAQSNMPGVYPTHKRWIRQYMLDD